MPFKLNFVRLFCYYISNLNTCKKKGQLGGVETGARSTHMFITEKLRRSPLAAPQNQGGWGGLNRFFFFHMYI